MLIKEVYEERGGGERIRYWMIYGHGQFMRPLVVLDEGDVRLLAFSYVDSFARMALRLVCPLMTKTEIEVLSLTGVLQKLEEKYEATFPCVGVSESNAK